MTYLTSESLFEALTLCCTNSGFKVCVIFRSSLRMTQFSRAFESKRKESMFVTKITKIQSNSGEGLMLTFYNGSALQTKMIEDETHGEKFNYIIIDDDPINITPEEATKIEQWKSIYRKGKSAADTDEVLFATKFWSEKTIKETEMNTNNDTVESPELDAYLEGFKINP